MLCKSVISWPFVTVSLIVRSTTQPRLGLWRHLMLQPLVEILNFFFFLSSIYLPIGPLLLVVRLLWYSYTAKHLNCYFNFFFPTADILFMSTWLIHANPGDTFRKRGPGYTFIAVQCHKWSKEHWKNTAQLKIEIEITFCTQVNCCMCLFYWAKLLYKSLCL